ncbi:hypothetical protein IW150_003846, partial [Coemansia sp. RSA 2607]
MTNSSTQMQTAVVKLALSGDTLVLRGALRGNQAPAERTLTLSHITAPRLASAKRGEPDAPGAYASREFLRRRVAGKRVHFAVRHATANREFGLVELDGVDVAMLLVREGWAQLSTHARARLDRGALRDADEEAEVRALADAEQLARAGRRGLWAPPGAVDARPRVLVFDGDAAAFVRAHAGRELKATVEHVRDAATLRLAVHLPTCHQTLTLQMAGVRAPSTQPGASEPFADEARFQAEAKLLHHDVHVTIAAAAATSGVFVGSVRHPAGNIAEWLVSAGYARVNDATAAHVPGGPQRLRDLERDARDRRVNIWRDHVAPQKPQSSTRAFDATVVRVFSGDTLVVRRADADADEEVQLASVRQPRADGDTAGYAEQAREQLRRLVIGKTVHVTVDYTRPASDTQRERTCATVRLAAEDV